MGASRYRLLVVEDEAPVRVLVSTILRTLGHEVHSAEDGFSALKQIQQATPDIILSDLNMPGMSGFELLSVVRRRLPGIYVIATSGAYSGTEVPNGIAADAFYQKASGMKGLLDLVSNGLKRDADGTRDAEPAPIWICRDGDAGCDPVITCPECLRNSGRACADAVRTIHTTDCSACGAAIQYAVILPMDVIASKSNLPGLHAEVGDRRSPAAAG